MHALRQATSCGKVIPLNIFQTDLQDKRNSNSSRRLAGSRLLCRPLGDLITCGKSKSSIAVNLVRWRITGRRIPGRPKGERRRTAAGVPQTKEGRNGNTDSVSERTGDGKSSGFPCRHVSGTAGAGIKRPLNRQRTEIVTAKNFCRYSLEPS